MEFGKVTKVQKWIVAGFVLLLFLWGIVTVGMMALLGKSAIYLKHNGLKGAVESVWNGDKG